MQIYPVGINEITGAELDNVFSSVGLLKRTGTATYGIDSSVYLTAEADTLATVMARGATTALQLTSTLAIGTSPFIITSTTVNTNLNADLWNGHQFASYLNQAVLTTSDVSFDDLTLTGLLKLPTTTLSVGQIQINNSPVFHTYTHSLATYNNLFIGGAGNFTLHKDTQNYEGSGNFGAGPGALTLVTHGYYNFALGQGSLGALTTGNSNIGIGTLSGYSLADGSNNVYIGRSAGSLNVSGSSNINIGTYAGTKNLLSNRLIFDVYARANSDTEITNAILYGVMGVLPADQTLRINALVGIGKTPTVALDVVGAVLNTTTIEAGTGFRCGGTGAATDGTYANPTSISIKGGIITAIS